jgi:cytoskeletal protein CcmA (bactofilin family)
VLSRGKGAPIDKIETVIGPNTNFKGTLICDGSVRIDGVCEEGRIETIGNIVVGPEAKVAADLVAENVSVSGAVTGKITASGRLEILSTGKVWGDAEVGSFLLDEDGYFRGNLVMKNEPEPPNFGLLRQPVKEEITPPQADTQQQPAEQQPA